MSIILEQLTKRYDGHPVVNDVSLEIADGEFFVLLGSSGSGKTTVLSMIAGLTAIEEGRILLHGRDVTNLPTQERNVGYVFQNYALFQHMTVADNIEFGLRVRSVPAAQRRKRRDELLELVGLAGLGGRMPRQISGGQQQRVALARALAHKPDVLLLDEPLGALDAKIRIELRRTLKAIQRELKVTSILVTHDQEEAFELADRLGVMSFGRLLEVGLPEVLYQQPQTEFVATFLGTANLWVGQATHTGVQVGPHHFSLQHEPGAVDAAQRVQVLFRPEDVTLAPAVDALAGQPLGQGVVEEITFAGSFERLRLSLPPIPGVRAIAPPVAYGSQVLHLEATRTQDQVSRFPLLPGQSVWVGINRIHALTHPGLRFLLPTDGSAPALAALVVASQIAKLAHARVTILGYGLAGAALQNHLQEAKEQMGSGPAALETRASNRPPDEAIHEELERHPSDLVVLGSGPHNVALAEQILQTGEHHLLLVPCSQPTPQRALICVASGEPGKEDVLFTGRLVRHLGATAQVLTVLTEAQDTPETRERVHRFLGQGVQTLETVGVPATKQVRVGRAREVILDELKKGGHDLLVLGAPLPDADGKIVLTGLVGHLIRTLKTCPILLVRTPTRGGPAAWNPIPSRTPARKEIV
ncbi:MAG: ATP-binding cassette domain-containing protein [Caldilineaceae bacterium]|nr:ATP-binding cassette domain-containing protein [Caldilineaceae bacterium]